MPALTLAASMLVVFWNSVPLASAFCPLPSQCFHLAHLDFGKRHEGPLAAFGSVALTKVDAKDRLNLAMRALGRERDGDLHGAVADYAILNKEACDNAWARERLEWCQGLLQTGNKNLDRLLMAVRIAPGKFVRTYYSAVMDCDARTRHLLLHLLDARIRVHPSDDAALCLRGLIFHADGRFQDAIQDYKLFLWNHPHDTDIYLFLALAQRLVGDKYGALGSARQLIQQNANDGFNQTILASLVFETGNPGEAVRIVSRAIELCPSPGWPYYIRGVIRAKLGKNALALDDLSRARQDENWWPEATRLRCVVRAASGDLNGALADAEELVKQKSRPEAIRLRACVHCLRCESISAIADILRSQEPGNRELDENENAASNEAINPFGIRLQFNCDDLLSEQQDILCRSHYVVAALLVGNRHEAAGYVWSLRLQSGWRPSLARGYYFATGGDYGLALRELRLALKGDSLPAEDVYSFAPPAKNPEEKKVAAADHLSYASIAELMSGDGGAESQRVPQKTTLPPLAGPSSFKSSPK